MQVRLKVNPADIDFLNRVFEGYDYLGTVSTIDRRAGVVGIWVTPNTRAEVIKILENFPREVEMLDD